jgi:putative SOS response-associated peptidase YedK
MCGRFQNFLPPEAVARYFGTRNVPPNYPPRYNIAPTDPVLVVRFNPRAKERSLDALRWGLVPHWAKDLSFGARCINARAETVDRLPAFRDAFAGRRCLIPAGGFYEWEKIPSGKQPYAIVPADEPLFAFAGLWENWHDRRAGAEWIRTCSIIVGPANDLVAPIHDRMPVILDRGTWPKWLGEEPAEPDELRALLKPSPSGRMRAYRVSPRVGSVKNDDASLLEAVA